MATATPAKPSVELVPTDSESFEAALAVLADSDVPLSQALGGLLDPKTLSESSKPSVMPRATKLPEKVVEAMNRLPKIFGKIQPPVERRTFSPEERKDLRAERSTIDAIIGVLTKRKTEINEMISTHFDVLAEEQKMITDDTPKDAKGHYCIARPGFPEREPVGDDLLVFSRERQGDQAVLDADLLLAAWREGQISRYTYYGLTYEVRERRVDEDAVRTWMLSAQKRPRVMRAMQVASRKTLGRNSIYLRKA